MSDLDRRSFVMAAGGAVALASPARVFAQSPGPARLAVRRPVGEMQPNDPMLASYRVAVERMKALPAGDPRNWNRLAQVHVDFCPHGNWFFLPWHRAYLVSFERLCRQLSGNPDFVLPYWDWTAQRQLPPAFTAQTVAGRRNPLYDDTRQMGAGASLRAAAVGEAAIARVMAETSFELFASTRPTGQNSTDTRRWLRETGRTTALEGGPHNTTHVAVGGDMADMISPRDPIFWLHHCNIDRLWARWNALGRRNPSSTLWTQFGFNGIFVQPQGQGTAPWNVGVSDVLDHRAFGYTYPDLPAAAAAAAEADADPEPRVLASASVSGTAGVRAVLSTRLPLPRRAAAVQTARGTVQNANDILHEEAPKAAADDAPAALPDGRLFSVLDGAGAAQGDAVTVNVFLNSLNPAAATEDDPHFVGTFGLFGLRSHAAHGGLGVVVELTATLARLRQAGAGPGADLDIQLVPVEARGSGLQFKLDRIDLVTM